ncbi:hypothetical protein TREMEDRAFT_58488 [Tremella mesenterica DSM 1558]|uniref:uncharacterized protein n=1 Tax=Tremella mesenterica (strain ATCC 24925 / CBS 8224 / DSM 1558 / NBRC 9311 / NRRL Y-6157 / RJB 2259-6 / UBC 559-6) TaxID=578456 RepID=UPI0003F4973D|nr:uncharacterized protein TREMEDRAFT_58488 [Tremella mesenterica DSM 1558]EIW72325.1 hypothetical protein TREMEDRAFT_58488 [Tremella mesenterica DSM 1558]
MSQQTDTCSYCMLTIDPPLRRKCCEITAPTNYFAVHSVCVDDFLSIWPEHRLDQDRPTDILPTTCTWDPAHSVDPKQGHYLVNQQGYQLPSVRAYCSLREATGAAHRLGGSILNHSDAVDMLRKHAQASHRSYIQAVEAAQSPQHSSYDLSGVTQQMSALDIGSQTSAQAFNTPQHNLDYTLQSGYHNQAEPPDYDWNAQPSGSSGQGGSSGAQWHQPVLTQEISNNPQSKGKGRSSKSAVVGKAFGRVKDRITSSVFPKKGKSTQVTTDQSQSSARAFPDPPQFEYQPSYGGPVYEGEDLPNTEMGWTGYGSSIPMSQQIMSGDYAPEEGRMYDQDAVSPGGYDPDGSYDPNVSPI